MRTGIKRVFSINSHTTNAYPITKEVHETDPTYQNYMNGFFKAFRVPVRVRYHSGFHLQTKAGSVADLQTERVIKL